MKEASGEGSLSIVTIVIIAGILAAGAIIVGVMLKNVNTTANQISGDKDTIETTIKSQMQSS